MKKCMVMLVLMTAAAAAVQAQVSLADARGKIDGVIGSPDSMGELMKGLSAADQRKFLADVNKAIGDMPASVEERTAKFLNVNRAALKAAQKGSTAELLAEVFATVPPEALTVINERFASDLFNRAADPKVTYTDERYAAICTNLMAKVNERAEETDNASVRSAFAILMLLRGSNETGDALEKLQGQLVDTLKHDDAKELARDEWIPAALGKDGREKSYEPLLASADAGRRPDFAMVFSVAGPQHLDALLADLVGKNTDPLSSARTHTPVLDAALNPLALQAPTLRDEPFGDDVGVPFDPANPGRWPHPGPYAGQWF